MKKKYEVSGIEQLMDSDPVAFMQQIKTLELDLSSIQETQALGTFLDSINPHKDLSAAFESETEALAGHSLGPAFKGAKVKREQIYELQRKKLHEGHFSTTSKEGGNWFDCDIDPEAIAALKPMLNFDEGSIIYTHCGLSDNFVRMLHTFYFLTADDWDKGQVKICQLAGEFCSDQYAIHTAVEGEIKRAQGSRRKVSTEAREYILEIPAQEPGTYDHKKIVDFIRQNAAQIKILHLSDIIFNMGHRLNIPRLLADLNDVIQQHQIIVGLDLAHSLGNRSLDLRGLPVTYAISCGYKHLCLNAGNGAILYINPHVDLSKFPLIQAWKAADSAKIFSKINQCDTSLLHKKGALAFRLSNPNPMVILPMQEYIKTMHAKGWDKLVALSESKTLFLLELLKKNLGDKIKLITPENPEERGAMLVFRVPGLQDIGEVERLLKAEGFESDTRPPDSFRLLAHYAYTRFEVIARLVDSLKFVINSRLQKEAAMQGKPVSVVPNSVFKSYKEPECILFKEPAPEAKL